MTSHCWRSRILVSLAAFSLAACSELPTKEPSDPSTPAAAGALKKGSLESVSDIGCAVAMSTPAGVIASHVSRPNLPITLPVVSATTHTPVRLHAVSLRLSAQGTASKSFTVTCVTPQTIHQDAIYALIQHSRQAATTRFLAALDRPEETYPSTMSDVAAASLVLANAFTAAGATMTKHTVDAAMLERMGLPQSQQAVEPLPQATTTQRGLTPPAAKKYGSDCCYQLPTIYVIEARTYTYVDLSLLWGSMAEPKYPGGFSFVYDPIECELAVDAYLNTLPAMQSALDDLVADSANYDNVLSALENGAFCERRTDGKTKCVDMYIHACRAFVFNGDCRGSDPNAGYAMSRVQMYLNLDEGSGIAYISPSSFNAYILPTWISPDSYHTIWSSYPVNMQKWHIDKPDPNTAIVSFTFYDGFCDNVPCPPIDGFIKFAHQSDGTWVKADIQRDAYPSLDIFQQRVDGSFAREYHEDEKNWLNLFTRAKTLEQWRQRMYEVQNLPRGCNLY